MKNIKCRAWPLTIESITSISKTMTIGKNYLRVSMLFQSHWHLHKLPMKVPGEHHDLPVRQTIFTANGVFNKVAG
jgi:hypothetical protein